MACRMIENSPEISAWLATTEASVATTSMGQKAWWGTECQNGSVLVGYIKRLCGAWWLGCYKAGLVEEYR